MLSRKQLYRLDAGRNTHYYTEQLDDYYSQESRGGTADLSQTAAQWHGRGAATLGLSGQIDPARFADMLRGQIAPGLSTRDTVRHDAKKRTALDLTFSAPKSVTIQALIGKDPAVVRAHDHAVNRTLDYIEQNFCYARRRQHGKCLLEQTGNLVVAKWRHKTARLTASHAVKQQIVLSKRLQKRASRLDRRELERSGKACTAGSALEHALIARFGTLGRVPVPFLLRSDNGLVFTSRDYTALVRGYGLRQEFITPHCPQQNGMLERVIRTLKEQYAHRHRFETLRHASRVIGDWIRFYNHQRPHQALKMKTPAQAYALAA